jgi:hypothetical protein
MPKDCQCCRRTADNRRRRCPSCHNLVCSRCWSIPEGTCVVCNMGPRLTYEQTSFLRRHRIPLSRVFDASGYSPPVYSEIMKRHGYVVATGVTPCRNYGHTLRSRGGNCVQCNSANLAFQQRWNDQGIVYIAESRSLGLVKVGVTGCVWDRLKSLISQGYGGGKDWEIIERLACSAAGQTEWEIHRRLKPWYVATTFQKSGELVFCQETFSCQVDIAVSVVREVVAMRSTP